MSREKIISVVRKLLNLSEGSNFEGEIIAATKAAQDLIEKHAIEEAELHCGPCEGSGQVRSADGYINVACPTCSGKGAVQEEEEAYGREFAFTMGANLSRWESTLARAIANVVGTVKWYYENHHVRKDAKTGVMLKGSRRATQIMYYGPAEDVAVACEMFTDISQTIVTMAVLKWKGAFKGSGLAYCCGFVLELASEAHRRTAAKSLSSRQGITTELAVRTRSIMLSKRTKATQWLKQECGVQLARGSARGVGPPAGHDVDAYGEGMADGRAHGLSVGRAPKIVAQAALPKER